MMAVCGKVLYVGKKDDRLFFQQKKWKVNVRKEDVNIVWEKHTRYLECKHTRYLECINCGTQFLKVIGMIL